MWAARTEELASPEGLRVRVLRDGEALATRAVLDAWRGDESFQDFFSELLAGAAFEAFFFETPPVTRESLGAPFEFVLLPAPFLATGGVDGGPFRPHFQRAAQDEQILTFPNLSGDAQLIVPCPRTDEAVYAHLAVFVRRAPRAQQRALWREVGNALERNLQARPIWLSTAGGGVYWLHVRLDSQPKYVRHQSYRSHRGHSGPP